MPALSRRSFLAASAGLVLVAACGSDGDEGGSPLDAREPATTGGGTPTSEAGAGAAALSLLRFFPDGLIEAGREQRLVFGLADADGILVREAPAELAVRIVRDGVEVAPRQVVRRHDEGLPRAYYPVRARLEPGIYDVVADVEGSPSAAFDVVDPERVAVPGPGDPMVPLATPTLADPRGVEPICTNPQICPLHDVTLAEALGEGRPLAFLVATPAFCQQATCGPVLDVLLATRDAFPDVRMVHAEVYVKPAESLDRVTEAVTAYRLPIEPVLFLAGPDGVVRERLDTIFDGAELREALGRLTA